MNESCTFLIDGFNISDLAITGTQASQIIIAIASYFLVMWLLRQLRFNVK